MINIIRTKGNFNIINLIVMWNNLSVFDSYLSPLKVENLSLPIKKSKFCVCVTNVVDSHKTRNSRGYFFPPKSVMSLTVVNQQLDIYNDCS